MDRTIDTNFAAEMTNINRRKSEKRAVCVDNLTDDLSEIGTTPTCQPVRIARMS
jgi:hypothetical protein